VLVFAGMVVHCSDVGYNPKFHLSHTFNQYEHCFKKDKHLKLMKHLYFQAKAKNIKDFPIRLLRDKHVYTYTLARAKSMPMFSTLALIGKI
jgi:hypothetical protein